MPPEILIKEGAPHLDVLQRNISADVTVPAAEVEIQQQAPRIFLDQQAPIIDVNQIAPRVEFIQREPLVHVNQPKAQVIINQQKPEVKIQSAKPLISITKCDAPQIQVSQQEPVIKLIRNDPIVRVSELRGQPEVILQKFDNCVLNWKPIEAPILTVSKGRTATEFGQTQYSSTPTGSQFKKEEITLVKRSDSNIPPKFEKRADWLNEEKRSSQTQVHQY
eukprot:gene401-506_t